MYYIYLFSVALSICSSIFVVILSINATIIYDKLESSIHEASIASGIDAITVDQLLL
jgi:hypothetical protein